MQPDDLRQVNLAVPIIDLKSRPTFYNRFVIELEECRIKGYNIEFLNGEIFCMFDLDGPDGSPYQGYVFTFRIRFPKDYPHGPPVIKNVTRIWNVFIPEYSVDGTSASDFLSLEGNCWNVFRKIGEVVDVIKTVLQNPKHLQNKVLEKGIYWPNWNLDAKNQNTPEFNQKAREWAQKYATPQPIIYKPTQPEKYDPYVRPDPQDHSDLNFKGVAEEMHNFSPDKNKNCESYVRDIKIKENERFGDILRCCIIWRNDFKRKHTPLDDDELLAVGLYTFDLRYCEGHLNFYYQLNKALQERQGSVLQQWRGYLYYFRSALSKLPLLVGVNVYRGLPINTDNDKETFQKNYTIGRRIHWSGYTSTSQDLDKAKKFAKEGGLIMQINVVHARSLADYSVYKSEVEVLLNANSVCLVTAEMTKLDEYYYIKLQQEDPRCAVVY